MKFGQGEKMRSCMALERNKKKKLGSINVTIGTKSLKKFGSCPQKIQNGRQRAEYLKLNQRWFGIMM